MPAEQTAVDLKYLHTLLVERMKVKRRPVAVTYCEDRPPPGYEPANVVACAIIREAEAGRRVYVDAHHQDCWVGQYHLGWLPDAGRLITEGQYLTMAQGFLPKKVHGATKHRVPCCLPVRLLHWPLRRLTMCRTACQSICWSVSPTRCTPCRLRVRRRCGREPSLSVSWGRPHVRRSLQRHASGAVYSQLATAADGCTIGWRRVRCLLRYHGSTSGTLSS